MSRNSTLTVPKATKHHSTAPAEQTNGKPEPARARVVEDPSLPEARRKVSVNGLAWLQTYCDGGGLSVDVIRRPDTDAEWTFISGRPSRQQRSKL